MCPLCWKLYSTSIQVFDHCRQEGRKTGEMNNEQKRRCEIHQALGAVTMGGDFRKFRESLATACGQPRREIPVKELPLDFSNSGRRPYGSCLGTRFIVKNLAPVATKRVDILKNLAHKAGIHHSCPSCWKGFAKPEQVTRHCAIEIDESHAGLLSKDVKTFVRLYKELLEQKALPGQKLDLTHMEIDFDGQMVPDFHKCFHIERILGHLCKYRESLLCNLI